jgi:hypothetical protein
MIAKNELFDAQHTAAIYRRIEKRLVAVGMSARAASMASAITQM